MNIDAANELPPDLPSEELQGAQTTKFRDQARKAVLKSVNGDEACDCVVFAGSGSSAAIEKLQQVLGLSHRKSSKLRNRPVIFVSSAEHHSNLISWKENHCDVEVIPMAKDGRIDIGILEARLRASRYRKLKMGSFSAASNITGIHFQVSNLKRQLKPFKVFGIST